MEKHREGSGFLCPDPQIPELSFIQRQEAPESSDSKPVLELQNEQTQPQQKLEECPPIPTPTPRNERLSVGKRDSY